MRYSSYFKRLSRNASKAAKARWAKRRAEQDELLLASAAAGEAIWCVPDWRGKLWRVVTVADAAGDETVRIELWTPRWGEGRIDQVRVVVNGRDHGCMGMTRVAEMIRKAAVHFHPSREGQQDQP